MTGEIVFGDAVTKYVKLLRIVLTQSPIGDPATQVVLDRIPSGDPNTQSLYNVTMDDISIWGFSADAQGFSVAGTGVLLDTGSNLLSVPSSVRSDKSTETDHIGHATPVRHARQRDVAHAHLRRVLRGALRCRSRLTRGSHGDFGRQAVPNAVWGSNVSAVRAGSEWACVDEADGARRPIIPIGATAISSKGHM
jgi:hypothetical protein